ncbi:MAG TPA: glycerol-3-phosphate 1-O-acyltransferase PlsY [Blastocatellia bacterium]|jgi:glycerol-3-phosphate acyltransferase PlsY
MLARITFVLIAYLLGAIPFGYLLVKFVFTSGEDIRRVGSGGTGATNVSRRAGWTAGILTVVLDALKGVAAVMLMKRIAGDDYLWMGAAAIAAIVGHIFPVFLGFRGGKGVATGAGVFLVLAPLPVIAAFALYVVTVLITRYSSLGSIIASLSIPILILLFYGWLLPSSPHPQLWTMVATTALAGVLIVAKHHENIRRLASGTESKLGSRAARSGDE